MSDDLISRKAVIKAVDRHTREDGTLDDDISIILVFLKRLRQPLTRKGCSRKYEMCYIGITASIQRMKSLRLSREVD